MFNVYHSPAQLFCSFDLSLSALHQLQRLSQLQQSQLPMWFPLSDMAIATVVIGHFIFRVVDYPYLAQEPG